MIVVALFELIDRREMNLFWRFEIASLKNPNPEGQRVFK